MAKVSYDVQYDLDQIRNIGIIAHIDAGKTTTTERLLYFSGQIHKIGETHNGESVTDFMEQEKERGITIMSDAVTCFWKYKGKDFRVNIIDTPGHVDFTVEVERSLRILDGAVVIFDGKMGVEPQSETVWRQADKYKVPRVCFINKLNLVGGDFAASLKSIKDRLNPNAVAITLPIGREHDLRGVIDLVKMKAFTYTDINQENMVEEEIPADMKDEAEMARAELVEVAASQDDALMEKFFAGEELTEDEIYLGIRKGTLNMNMFPVMGGDSRSAISKMILDLVTYAMPSPQDVPPVVGVHPKTNEELTRVQKEDEPFSALVFKISNDPHIGTLSYFRVYSGKVDAGSYVYNSTKGKKERISRLVLMHAEDREEVQTLRAGDIGAIVGLKDSVTGDTLCIENDPVILEKIEFSEPVISQAIEPKTKSDEEKLSIALGKLMKEDPTFKVQTNHETGQTIISGMGELHLEIMVDRLDREHNVQAQVGKPQVAYRETIRIENEAEGKYVKQSGGRGQYGHCWLRVEPNTAEGFEFVDAIKGGSIPKEFISSIRKGVENTLNTGVIAGFPVVDVKVTVYDGSFHDVDSNDAAFQVAGSMGFKEAMRGAKPSLLEPLMKVEVTVPDDYVGDVTGSLSSKRGIIEGSEVKAGGIQMITARVPMSELFGYTTELRSITSGRGSASVEFHSYSEVPASIVEGIKGGK